MKLETSFLRRGVAAAGLLAGLMLGGAALAQSADNAAQPAPPPPAAGMPDAGHDHFAKHCKADPQKCAEMKQRMEERMKARKAACDKGPDACKAWREQERAKREEWCKANAQKCAEMKQRMEAHRAACKADPKAPHCHPHHRPMPPADGTPVPPPTPPNASAQ